jgi:hypothetical protein
MDFTIEKYRELLVALKSHNNFRIRHDVDLKPAFSLRIAQVEAELGLHGTYYFRTVPESYDEAIIQQIVSLGHTAGYHYECMTTCDGNIEAAYEDFCRNLEKLRGIAPISTACAHGSPKSKWNSQDIWNQYDIHTTGIDYEPMLDTDFSTTLYLTDTGRRWDGYKMSVRDKVPGQQERWEKEGLVFHKTDDIIHAINDINHPIHHYSLLINTHPQRWMPFGAGWMKEMLLQNAKNIVKRIIVSTK